MSNLHRALVTNAMLFVAMALGILVAPIPVLRAVGFDSAPIEALALVRLVAGLLLLMGATLWALRHSLEKPEAHAALSTIGAAYVGVAGLAIVQQIAIWANLAGLLVCTYLGWVAAQYIWHGYRLRQLYSHEVAA